MNEPKVGKAYTRCVRSSMGLIMGPNLYEVTVTVMSQTRARIEL